MGRAKISTRTVHGKGQRAITSNWLGSRSARGSQSPPKLRACETYTHTYRMMFNNVNIRLLNPLIHNKCITVNETYHRLKNQEQPNYWWRLMWNSPYKGHWSNKSTRHGLCCCNTRVLMQDTKSTLTLIDHISWLKMNPHPLKSATKTQTRRQHWWRILNSWATWTPP